jgi:hypothetical protein
MELDSLTMSEFDGMGMQLIELDLRIKSLEEETKRLNALKSDLVGKILFVMEKTDKTSYQVGGAKLVRSQRATVPTPKTKEDKEALFNWLTERDLFWHYAGVNSQALNALYKAEREAAVEAQNLDFVMPGVGKESVVATLSIRR